MARATAADDRRKAAEALAGHPASAEGRAALRVLASDADPGVRAAALWSLGRAGDAADVARLVAAIADRDPSVSADAVAALARVAARTKGQGAVAPRLCALLPDPRAYVVVNALAGLRLLGATCPEGGESLLSISRPAVVRRAAAVHLRHRVAAGGDPAQKAAAALARCATDERDAEVADACAGPALTPVRGEVARELSIFVVADGGSEPRGRSPFAVARPDGFVHLGIADRRGALLERDLGRGEVRLEVPAPLVR